MDNTKEFRLPFLSFCTGMRGIERGIERVIPIRSVAYVEIESFIIENLVCEMEQGMVDPAPVFTDLKTFDPAPFRGKIWGITAGYPCQPFSIACHRKGSDDPRHLFPFIYRAAEATRPFCLFFENVEGHLQLGYAEVYKSLRNLGYSVESGIFSAQEAGAPHKRRRLFILALANTGFITSGTRRPAKIPAETATSETTTWENYWQWMRDFFDNRSSSLANGVGQRLQRANFPGKSCLSEKNRPQKNRQSAGKASNNVSQWPAGPGPFQHEWEAKREVKPGVGCTVDGFNFREDLLRMYGNGVVEQTAEIAFRTLMKKHFENGQRQKTN